MQTGCRNPEQNAAVLLLLLRTSGSAITANICLHVILLEGATAVHPTAMGRLRRSDGKHYLSRRCSIKYLV